MHIQMNAVAPGKLPDTMSGVLLEAVGKRRNVHLVGAVEVGWSSILHTTAKQERHAAQNPVREPVRWGTQHITTTAKRRRVAPACWDGTRLDVHEAQRAW